MDKTAAKSRDMAAEKMSPPDISKAQRLAREWRPGRQAVPPPRPRPTPPTAAGQRIAHVQRDLAALGYDPGPADGILGPQTRAAIRAFQAREELPVTGVVSEELAAALQSATGR